MPKLIFDSNKIIERLRMLRNDSTPADAERLAKELIEEYDTRAIVSPVEIEILAGVRDSHELKLTETFLGCFEVIDQGKIPPGDWQDAKRQAKHVVKYDRQQP